MVYCLSPLLLSFHPAEAAAPLAPRVQRVIPPRFIKGKSSGANGVRGEKTKARMERRVRVKGGGLKRRRVEKWKTENKREREKRVWTGNRSHVNCGGSLCWRPRAYGSRGRSSYFPVPRRKNGRINGHYLVAAAGKLRGTSGHRPFFTLLGRGGGEAVLIIPLYAVSTTRSVKIFSFAFQIIFSFSFFFFFLPNSFLPFSGTFFSSYKKGVWMCVILRLISEDVILILRLTRCWPGIIARVRLFARIRDDNFRANETYRDFNCQFSRYNINFWTAEGSE